MRVQGLVIASSAPSGASCVGSTRSARVTACVDSSVTSSSPTSRVNMPSRCRGPVASITTPTCPGRSRGGAGSVRTLVEADRVVRLLARSCIRRLIDVTSWDGSASWASERKRVAAACTCSNCSNRAATRGTSTTTPDRLFQICRVERGRILHAHDRNVLWIGLGEVLR